MECPECKAKVTEDQRYCERCGSELPKKKPEKPIPKKSPSPSTPSIPSQQGGLFDLSRNFYLIRENAWDLGFGSIYDEKGGEIGRMNRIIFSIRRRVELLELDGSVAATIHSKLVSARGAQDLKDPGGNLIARIKRKILTFMHPTFFLEDPLGRRWYEARGNFFGWSFQVYEVKTGNLIAEIEKADRWRDVFMAGIFDYADTYALRIHDNVTDRRILVGFVLSIDNVMHDQSGGAGIWIGPGIPGRRTPHRGRAPGTFRPPAPRHR